MNVTFCGHSQIADSEKFTNWLDDILPALIEGGADKFYMGGHGDFDMLAALAVKQQKNIYKNIMSIIVLAYPDYKYKKDLYDKAIYPALERVPSRLAVIKCSQFMVAQSDVLVSGVVHSSGRSVKTLAYAKKSGKVILQYPFYTIN